VQELIEGFVSPLFYICKLYLPLKNLLTWIDAYEWTNRHRYIGTDTQFLITSDLSTTGHGGLKLIYEITLAA